MESVAWLLTLPMILITSVYLWGIRAVARIAVPCLLAFAAFMAVVLTLHAPEPGIY
jgi:hypothetical protein